MIVVVLVLLGGAIFNLHSFYWIGGIVIAGGYLVNAALLLKLMVAY